METTLTKQEVDTWCSINGFGLIKIYSDSDPMPLTKHEIRRGGVKEILARVSKLTGMPVSKILLRTRERDIVEVRQLVQAISRKHLRVSLAHIAWHTGRFNHATVIHSGETVNTLVHTDKVYAEKYEDVISLYSLKDE